ncbi:hypothetical protein ZWY2020_051803 [Hordeum vulgare]|nr:hypothetical protein ZWY2020_051803 [Hordeum vulgare]
MKLTPNIINASNPVSNQLYLAAHHAGLHASAGSTHQIYYQSSVYYAGDAYNGSTYIALLNRSLSIFPSSSPPSESIENVRIDLPPARSFQYMRFESDGHLRLYEWDQNNIRWSSVYDIFQLDYCDYPTICGEYGICRNGQCICPVVAGDILYFKQADTRNLSLGCISVDPIPSCQSAAAEEDHHLVALSDVSYFNYNDPNAAIPSDEESCRQACSSNCSCKAAFHISENSSNGSCFLVSEVLSMKGYQSGSTAYLKVYTKQSVPRQNSSASAKKRKGVVTYAVAGATTAAVLFASVLFVIIRGMCNQRKEGDEEEFCEVPGMPTSGRRNIDYSQPDERGQLIMVLREKAMNSQLEDMIDGNNQDMLSSNKDEVIEIMKLAMWCLQSDSNRRPSMSVVVQVMEGEKNVESDLNYNFFDLSPAIVVPVGQPSFSAPPGASVLSAPR